MQYDSDQIKLKNIPRLEKIMDGECRRTYLYFFNDKLPQQNDIDLMARGIEKRFIFLEDKLELPRDIEIFASIIIRRLGNYQAEVTISTTHPEESCVYIFGIHTLPHRLEAIFGTVKSIQGQPREMWIY